MPSNGSTWVELRNGNVGRYIPAKVSLELQSLIVAMMAHDPAARPTPEQLLSHWKLRHLLGNRLYPFILKSVICRLSCTEFFNSCRYSSDKVPIYHQPAKLTSSPPIPEISLPLPPASKTPLVSTFLPSPVASVSPHTYCRPPSSTLSRPFIHSSSSESSGDDTPDDGTHSSTFPPYYIFILFFIRNTYLHPADDEFLVQPRALAALFTSEREKQRRESLEGTFESIEPPRSNAAGPIVPKNLLDVCTLLSNLFSFPSRFLYSPPFPPLTRLVDFQQYGRRPNGRLGAHPYHFKGVIDGAWKTKKKS
jgi:hypothetical protein